MNLLDILISGLESSEFSISFIFMVRFAQRILEHAGELAFWNAVLDVLFLAEDTMGELITILLLLSLFFFKMFLCCSSVHPLPFCRLSEHVMWLRKLCCPVSL